MKDFTFILGCAFFLYGAVALIRKPHDIGFPARPCEVTDSLQW